MANTARLLGSTFTVGATSVAPARTTMDPISLTFGTEKSIPRFQSKKVRNRECWVMLFSHAQVNTHQNN